MDTLWRSVLDLEDAFFCIPDTWIPGSSLPLSSKTSPPPKVTQWLTWTLFPQGFSDSPHLFGQALAKDLSTLQPRGSTLFQYDNLLSAAPMRTLLTQILSWCFAASPLRASPSKAHISSQKLQFLVLISIPGTKSLPDHHKSLILNMKALYKIAAVFIF